MVAPGVLQARVYVCVPVPYATWVTSGISTKVPLAFSLFFTKAKQAGLLLIARLPGLGKNTLLLNVPLPVLSGNKVTSTSQRGLNRTLLRKTLPANIRSLCLHPGMNSTASPKVS